MATPRRQRPVVNLVLAILFFAVAAAALIMLNPINTRHVTIQQPTPGTVTLPPTATPPATATATVTVTVTASPTS
jgi:hypothetical protein